MDLGIRNCTILFSAAIYVSAASVPPRPTAVPQDVLRQCEQVVARSIVRIERRTSYQSGAKLQQMLNHGTGVIVGKEMVNGHREYLILSNEHVAHNDHVAGRSTLFIVAGDGVRTPILLETLYTDSRRDQALLRTVRCETSFEVPQYVLGPPPEDVRRDLTFTEGYGNGKFNILTGDILSTQSTDWGIRCYTFDVAVGPGQSGAPLVVIGGDKQLYLPALVFCGTDQFTDATPLYPGKGVLHEFRAILKKQLADAHNGG